MDTIVRKITVEVVTSYAKGAGTEGKVFLGLGGREFRLDIDSHDDFDRGDEVVYELGEGSNVCFPDRNDPRTGLPISVDAVLAHPVYIRLVPDDNADDWDLANVHVRLHAADEVIRYAALEGPNAHIWLGLQSGNCLHLQRAD